MILFLLLLFPLASVWLILSEIDFRQMLLNLRDYFLFGILFFIPSFFFVNILTGFLSQTYTVLNIYLYHFFADYFFYQFFCILSCILRFRNVMYCGTGEGISRYFLFMAGFYTAFAFYSAIHNYNSADFYTLFLLPVTLLLMSAYTSFFLTLRDVETGFIKYLFIAALFVFPIILALVPFFHYIKFQVFSFVIIAVIAGIGWFIFYKSKS